MTERENGKAENREMRAIYRKRDFRLDTERGKRTV